MGSPVSSISGADRIRANSELFSAAQLSVSAGEGLAKASQISASEIYATQFIDARDEAEQAAARENFERPVLVRPKPEAELTSNAKFTLLIAQLMALIGEISINELMSRFAIFKNFMEARNANLGQLSAAATSAVAAEAQALLAFEQAVMVMEEKKNAHEEARLRMAKAEAEVSAAAPGTPERQQAELNLALAASAFAQAQAAKLAAEMAGRSALSNYEQKTAVATQALGLTNAAVQLVHTQPIKEANETNLTSLARMTLLMASFIELVGKNSESTLRNSLSLFEAMQDARKAAMEKAAREYDAEVRKSEETAQFGGCIGKIIGGLLAAVMVIASIVTLGAATSLAALVVAAVTLVVVIADTITSLATGTSLTERILAPIMEPLMKNVIMPFIQFVADIISKILTAFGIDPEAVEKAANIIASVVVAIYLVVVVIVVALIAKTAATKFMDMFGTVIKEMIVKITPQVVMQLAKSASANAGSFTVKALTSVGLKSDQIALQIYVKNLSIAQSSLSLAVTGTQVGTGMAQGAIQEEISRLLAELFYSQNSSKQLSEFMKGAYDHFSTVQEFLLNASRDLSTIAVNRTETGLMILNGARHAARA
ncbi:MULTISPECIES: type III secretion system translocon subunit SctE [unclassified Undibacterium]|uniref:type III secretion system translocon subunit SctE n=1 Tax=unclassified Undibacterium TaxID=2630295 RepID=UPI002AC9201F|nr:MULTISPECIES: type III secretion system translocon subunit SctE [unclassified Undibacterium]MEB0140383.1 type III secretion system translocon subunit SctE [Undibacterium sp. CCC2.1]MEB0173417.1 type III secretion system translocon subunit SctE [Undibacterium sp. CCC1.1]MEB0177317.1 type III secretion system translocon subunit SctE [Undibacterium sp. CCC3.4]MEB0216574.1 type III secretion system translocon subunit SctE [Undibacterium sp. 5I2]WPX43476.1 type III secretion system translocon su